MPVCTPHHLTPLVLSKFSRFLNNRHVSAAQVGTVSKQGQRIIFDEKRVVGYSAEQLFEVVFRIEDYPLFVPWCKQVRVRQTTKRTLDAELSIGFPPLRESYKSRVTAVHPTVIRSVCSDGRLFTVFDTVWRFGPPPPGSPSQSSTLHFSLDFEFRSALYANVTHLFFTRVASTMVSSFLERAQFLYGKPSIVDHKV